MDTKTLLTNFFAGINRINCGHEAWGVGEERRIQRSITSMYDLVASRSLKGDIWNWGMDRPDVRQQIEQLLPHFNEYDTDGFSEELYFYALSQLPVDIDDYVDKSILEVGCGLGEGLNFLSRVVGARHYVGVDISERAIRRARARVARKGIEFQCGDAQRLPFGDGTFDVVINIESSHSYTDLRQFFLEVARVLKPGGLMSHVDMYTTDRLELLKEIKTKPLGLDWISEEDVSSAVRTAVTRRMQPDSLFRKRCRVRRERRVINKFIGERMAMSIYGAEFVGHRHDVLATLVKKVLLPSARVFDIDSYRHNVARKTAARQGDATDGCG